MEDKEVTVITLAYAPGGSSPPHRHPCPVFVYVLEGTVVSQVEGQPPATYHQGQMFYEAPNLVHAVSRNASTTQPAKLLVFFVGDKGQTLTTHAQ
jgi:quercetin dioxygenase-like cupin family protein